MDKLIIEFNKKFDKQKQELIDGFKALGEEKRLPKALATIEGEQPTYKNYFKAGWQSRQAELVDKDQRIHELNETSLDLEGHIYKLQEQLKEKDKRIKQALMMIDHIQKVGLISSRYMVEDVQKALKGNDQYTEHHSRAEQQINKGARLTKHQIDLGDKNANS